MGEEKGGVWKNRVQREKEMKSISEAGPQTEDMGGQETHGGV